MPDPAPHTPHFRPVLDGSASRALDWLATQLAWERTLEALRHRDLKDRFDPAVLERSAA